MVQNPEGSVCSTDALTYQCTTGGPAVAWTVDENIYLFNSVKQINTKMEGSGFVFSLVDIQQSNYIANSTIESVSWKDNGTRIICSDGSEYVTKVIMVTGMLNYKSSL